MRIGYLGPEGTFTHEAVLSAPGSGGWELVPSPTIYETVMAVHEGSVERALVPIENSIEGAVSATLDALVFETADVRIVGELVHPIRQCLIARDALELGDVEVIVSHPQANGQCTRFLRERLPAARVMSSSSTADAVRLATEHGGRWAALGNRLAAERWGGRVLLEGVEDLEGNETRFVWLARDGGGREPQGAPEPEGAPEPDAATAPGGASGSAWKTAIVFWGVGSESPGWLVACLAEFATRGVNLTRIESRPRKVSLGSYIFFVDLEGRAGDGPVDEALAAARTHVETLRLLGSFRAHGHVASRRA